MGLGTYSLSDEECYNSVTALLAAGGRLIDTAYMYHNEAASRTGIIWLCPVVMRRAEPPGTLPLWRVVPWMR